MRWRLVHIDILLTPDQATYIRRETRLELGFKPEHFLFLPCLISPPVLIMKS